MKRFYKVTALSLLLTVPSINSVYAMGSAKPAATPVVVPVTPVAPVAPSLSNNALVDLGLSFAIVYAKSDPRYAPILTALNINSPADLRAFLAGSENGSSLQNIMARLVFLKAQADPTTNKWLAGLGITNEASLRTFIKSAGASQMDLIFSIAYQQAASSSKYSVWLSQLNIHSAADLRSLLKNGSATNIQNLVLVVGLNYVNNNAAFAKYRQYIDVAMAYFNVQVGSDGTGSGTTSADDIINLGPFNGMTVGETTAVQTLK